MPKIEVVPNDNPKETPCINGSVRISHRRTWYLIVDGFIVDELETRREAIKKGKRYENQD